MSDEITPTPPAEEAGRRYQEGDYENAARLFGEAASALAEQNKVLEAAEMKNNQSVAWLQADNPDAAYEAARDTARLFAEAGDTRREGLAHGNEAAALQALGRVDEAYDKYRLSAEALQRAGEDELRNTVLRTMAGIDLKRGKLMDSMQSMQAGLAGIKRPTLKQRITLALLRLRTWRPGA